MQNQNNKIKEYIENIENKLKELEVKVNADGSLSSRSIYLIEVNGDKAKELTAKLEGFKDALRLMDIGESPN